MVNFLNFATLRPDISKTGGHTKKIIYTQNLLKVVRYALELKKLQIFFLLPVTKFCPLAKNCPDPKKLPKFFL